MKKPPRWVGWLLERFGHPDTLEEVQGDLLELYDYWVDTRGKRRADWRYTLSALTLLRPLAQSNKTDHPSPFFLNASMIRNYFTIAWRNLIRNKAFSGINILGLALGMTCSLLILLWVQDERSVDAFHANGSQLYQVYERQEYDGIIEANYFTQGLLADELKRVVPEVQRASSLDDIYTIAFEAGNSIHKLSGTFAGADFFQMFSYPLLQGTPATALNRPGGIAISRRMAEQFFGSADQAMGKSVRYQNKEDLQVTAVFENLPTNSSQQFDFLRPWVDFVKLNEWAKNWGNTNPLTFVQLRPGTNPATVEAKIKDFVYRYQAKNPGSRTELALQPYPEKYLHATFKNGQLDGGRIEYVHLFSLIALFILLIACVNFMNLATARSTKRAKEVGVRKVIGALRSALIGQFVGEAMLITSLAILLAVVLAWLLLPGFNSLTGKQLTLPVGEPRLWAMLLGLLLLTGFISGSYPALFLSSLNPSRVLKGSASVNAGAALFRKGLVVFQFSLSIMLIVGMIVMYRQTSYIQTKNLGYNRENLLYIPIEGDLTAKYDLLKNEAMKRPGIISVSQMRESPTQIGHHINDVDWAGKDPGLVTSFANTAVGYDFVKTMKLQLSEGRDFDRSFGTDSIGYLINETALAKIGYKNPVGKPLSWGQHKGTIVGVLNDFHFTTMHQAIEPLIIRLDGSRQWGTILVRTEAGKTSEALASLETLCRELNPKFPFTYQFSDLEYEKLYRSEQIVSQLASYFALLAIVISCLGLFGLSTFTAEQRTKEIGVRKVLGASVASVVTLLSTDFLKLVVIALVIATPVSWYVMNQWLRGFVYRIDIEWWMLAVAGVVAVCIAFLTISFQSIRAALMNPVNSLRSE
jgi:putative ABC transport system permease protein